MPAPYTTLTAQAAVRTGLTPAFTAAVAAGHQVPNNGRRALRFRNTDAAARTVTVQSIGPDGLVVAGRAVTVPATTGDVTTAFWPTSYTQTDGMLVWDYSATAGLTVAVIEFPRV